MKTQTPKELESPQTLHSGIYLSPKSLECLESHKSVKRNCYIIAEHVELDLTKLVKVSTFDVIYTRIGAPRFKEQVEEYAKSRDLNTVQFINIGTCGCSKYRFGEMIQAEFSYTPNSHIRYHLTAACRAKSLTRRSVLTLDEAATTESIKDYKDEYQYFDMELFKLADIALGVVAHFVSFKIVSDTVEDEFKYDRWEETLHYLRYYLLRLVMLIEMYGIKSDELREFEFNSGKLA